MLARVRWYRSWWRAERAALAARRRLEERFPGSRIARGVEVVSPERLSLGKDVVVQHGSVLHCGGLAWSQGDGSITIGDRAAISHNCVVWGAGHVRVGADVHLGPGCIVVSSAELHEEDPEDPSRTHAFAPVVIEDGVTLFAAVTVVPGVTIGAGAVIAAGATVTSDVPPLELWGGTPARRLRPIERRKTWGPSAPA